MAIARSDVLFWLPADNSDLDYAKGVTSTSNSGVTIGDNDTPTGFRIGSLYNDDTQAGALDYATLSHANTSWTLACWVKTTTASSVDYIWDFNTGGDRVTYGIDGTSGKARYGTTSNTELSDSAINDGNWHHIALVQNGTALAFYLDGSADGTATITAKQLNGAFALLGQEVSAGSYWNGNAKEFVAFNRNLTGTEISDLYNAGAGKSWTDYFGLDDDLYAYFSFNNSLTDELGNITLTDSGTANGTGFLGDGRVFTSGDFLEFDESADLVFSTGSQATFAGWFKTSTTGVFQYIINYRPDGGNPLMLISIENTNKARFYWADDSGNARNIISSGTYTDGNWHSFVATMDYSGSNVLYIDGVNVGSSSTTYTAALSLNNSGNTHDYWVIGAAYTKASNHFIGTLDEAAISNARAWTAGEAKRWHNYGAGRTYAELSNNSPVLEGLRAALERSGSNMTDLRGYLTETATSEGTSASAPSAFSNGSIDYTRGSSETSFGNVLGYLNGENISIAAWLYFDDADANQEWFGKQYNFDFARYTSKGAAFGYYANSAPRDQVWSSGASNPLPDTTWTHLAFQYTFGSGNINCWINSSDVTSAGSWVNGDGTNTTVPSNSTNTEISPTVGYFQAGNDFDGKLSQLLVYKNRALTLADTTVIYASGAGLPYPFTAAEGAARSKSLFFGGGF